MTNTLISKADERMETWMARHTVEPLTRIRTSDGRGGKLRDVVDPRTGYCTGVTSPTWTHGMPKRYEPEGVSGAVSKPEDNLRLDKATGLWYYGEDRVVVRTTDTPDGPMRQVRIAKDRTRNSEARESAKAKVKRAPKGDGKTNSRDHSARPASFSREEIAAYVNTKYGYTGPLSRQIIRAARVAMTHAQQVQAYTSR